MDLSYKTLQISHHTLGYKVIIFKTLGKKLKAFLGRTKLKIGVQRLEVKLVEVGTV